MNVTKRLKNSKYKRPANTYTDLLTNDDIIDKLEDYKRVDDIFKVPLGTHIRYFKNDKGKKKFRLGGVLIKNDGLPKYVVLSNGKFSWSVQIKDVVAFFRKMTINEIKNDYEELIDDLEQKNEKFKKIVKQLENENLQLKELLKKHRIIQ